MSVYFLRKQVIHIAQLNITCNFLFMGSIYGETLAPYHLHESSIVIAEQDQDERPSPQSFEPTRETSTRRRRRCTSEGVRSAFVSCGCDPSSTGPPADPTEGFPFEGAWRNKILSNHLSTLLSFILLNDQPCVCVPLTGKTLQLIFAYQFTTRA